MTTHGIRAWLLRFATTGACVNCGASWAECGKRMFACCFSCRHWRSS